MELNRYSERPGISRRAYETEIPIMQVMKSMNRPPGTIDLSQGIPFFGPPEGALKAMMGEINSLGRYGPDAGDDDLRDLIIKKISDHNGIKVVSRKNVMVTSGANIGFLNAITAVCDVGDEVILMDPYYFNHRMTLDILGVKHAHTVGDLFSMDGIVPLVNERTKAIVLVSPNNPTGEVADHGFIRELVDLCISRNLWLISDETYDMFSFDSPHLSPASLGDDLPVISLFSMSKAYGMSGYRIGYMVFPERLYDPLLKVQDTTVICPSRVGQRLAFHCLRDHSRYMDSMRRRFLDMRETVLKWRKENDDSIDSFHPSGGFYFFFSFKKKGLSHLDSISIAKKVLGEAGVLLVPGKPFGADSPPYLRISYGNTDLERLNEALNRLSDWLER